MANANKIKEKQAFVENLVEKIKNSNVGILISYKGISAKEVCNLRNEMREANATYFVVKNTMLKLASEKLNLNFSDSLTGTTALALAEDDPVGVSKILTNYEKKLKSTTEFKIKAGFLDGKLIDVSTIKEIGSLPSKEQLVGQLLSVLVAPIRGLAIAINEIAKQNDASA